MAIWGSFLWGEDTWGEPQEITSAQITSLASDQISLDLGTDFSTTDSALVTSNYSIEDLTDSREMTVVGVSVVEDSSSTLVIQTKNLMEDHVYQLSIADGTFYTLEGNSISVSGTVEWTHLRTKTDSILASFPQTYDTSSSSTLRSLLSAMSAEDERIGGR